MKVLRFMILSARQIKKGKLTSFIFYIFHPSLFIVSWGLTLILIKDLYKGAELLVKRLISAGKQSTLHSFGIKDEALLLH